MAVRVEWYERGDVKCGDDIGLVIAGELYVFVAMDAIARGDWYVIQPDGMWMPIGADLPKMHAPFEGLSTVGRMFNMTRKRQEFERRAGR